MNSKLSRWTRNQNSQRHYISSSISTPYSSYAHEYGFEYIIDFRCCRSVAVFFFFFFCLVLVHPTFACLILSYGLKKSVHPDENPPISLARIRCTISRHAVVTPQHARAARKPHENTRAHAVERHRSRYLAARDGDSTLPRGVSSTALPPLSPRRL